MTHWLGVVLVAILIVCALAFMYYALRVQKYEAKERKKIFDDIRARGALQKTFGTVEEKIWSPGDTYLVVQVQVFEEDGFKKGDKVEVLLRKAFLDTPKSKQQPAQA